MSRKYRERMRKSKEAERLVLAQLREVDWDAHPFGQALFPESIKASLKETNSLLRWSPDIIAIKVFQHTFPLLLDVKAESDEWPDTMAVEVSALEACEMFGSFGVLAWFIIDGLRVATPETVRMFSDEGNFRGRGSGTPFKVLQKTYLRPINKVVKEFEERKWGPRRNGDRGLYD